MILCFINLIMNKPIRNGNHYVGVGKLFHVVRESLQTMT